MVLISLCHVLGLCHSVKGYILPLPPLFHFHLPKAIERQYPIMRRAACSDLAWLLKNCADVPGQQIKLGTLSAQHAPSLSSIFSHQCDAPTPCFPQCFLPSCDFTFQKLKGSLMLSTPFSSLQTRRYTHRAWISDTHMHKCRPTHRERRFAALEMLPLLQIYSLKHERFPSRSIPGGC